MARTKFGTLLLAFLVLSLSACNTLQSLLPQPKPFEAHVVGEGYQTVAPGETATYTLRLSFREGAGPVTLRVALADPCAKGTSYCPGWDSTRYPGVEHPRETLTLTPGTPEVSLAFQVASDALPQGPFKYEVVLTGQDASGKTVEEVVPLYLKILPPGERSGMEAWNFWRSYLGLSPVREDPEWSFWAWLHSRYMAMNYPNNLPHDEDLSQPFASPEGQQAGRKGNEWGYFSRRSGQPYWPPEESPINGWIAAPFHRFNMIAPRATNGGFGIYKDAGPVPGYGDGYGRSWANLPNLYGGTGSVPYLLFPAPDRELALERYQGRENPNPTAPCMNPDNSPKRPFLTQEGLTWDDGTGVVRTPIGLPLTLQTFPASPVDTEVLEGRLTRLSDGSLNPLCAYGSLQYWEERDSWREKALKILRGQGAVIAFPHEPLTPGAEYEAYLKVRLGSEVREFTWRFRVASQGNLRPLRVEPAHEFWEVR
ncbi:MULTISPECIES: CAP domain-containing protein [Thermus]|jgi:hypothetical protein|uniref:CAP domain-containing protein n=1 Tax=Thermus TaxID=270 RepID=UPI00030E679B|nr:MULTISPECIES: CAP domain-containing protein [Thermus]QZY59649.1 CAP domain-containing protein [Thermus thermophilus]BDA38597.1 hypothetical protein JCM10941_19620 [Thermus thermophilus]BDE46560.1 hypothetical protein TthHB8_32460 [Thermus thermophilus]